MAGRSGVGTAQPLRHVLRHRLGGERARVPAASSRCRCSAISTARCSRRAISSCSSTLPQAPSTSPTTTSAFPSGCAGTRSCCVRPPTCWIAAASRCSSSRTSSRACIAEEAGPEQEAVRRQEAFALKEALAEAASDASVREALDAAVAAQNGTPGLPETLRAAARALGGPGLPPRLLAGRQLGDQLPPLLRHQPAGRSAHGAGRGVRGHPSPAAAPDRRGQGAGRAPRPHRRHVRPAGLLSAAAVARRRRARREPGRRTPRDRCAQRPPDLPAGREDPRPSREPARGSAGRRHHGLRVHQPA